ncbi:hypothetical protein HQ397_09140 [Aeromonas hydrophila]|uniref:hypothetical protein n=1 Tax=Aeromonas hydrophila TaxID=644 RepID=UPI001C741D41|nr:hypothetical protein [Aeromonas hydrophila]QWL70280.1 hypothetical protein HQ397_09140 [Aeromonas hydrophila]
MNNINPNNYIPGNTYVGPADGQGVENKEGLTGQGTTHEPGRKTVHTTPQRQALPELIGPRQGLDSSLLSKGGLSSTTFSVL